MEGGPPAEPTGLALEWGIQSPDPPMGEFCGTDMVRFIIPGGTQKIDARTQVRKETPGPKILDALESLKGHRGKEDEGNYR